MLVSRLQSAEWFHQAHPARPNRHQPINRFFCVFALFLASFASIAQMQFRRDEVTAQRSHPG